MAFDYVRDPDEIIRRSLETIEREADLARLPGDIKGVAMRIIHACGMMDVAEALHFSADAAAKGAAALRAGKSIFCDCEMVRHGIIARMLPAQNKILCHLNDERAGTLGKAQGITRSAAGVDLWGEDMAGAVAVIGNAPTALYRLLERLEAGAAAPAVVLGFPVGFIGAAESKQALIEEAGKYALPYITLAGRRGGSAMAAAAVNALSRMALDKTQADRS